MKCNSGRRSTRQTNDTLYQWGDDGVPAEVHPEDGKEGEAGKVGAAGRGAAGRVVARGAAAGCAPPAGDSLAMTLELLVDSKDILSADTLVRADHRATLREYFCYFIILWSIFNFMYALNQVPRYMWHS